MRLSIPASGILSYTCWWLWGREKLVVGKKKKKGGKNQENFVTASRERRNGISFSTCEFASHGGGQGGLVCVWSEVIPSTYYLGIRRLSCITLVSLLWCPSAVLLKAPQGITKLQAGHTAGTITPLANGDTNSETGSPRILTCRWKTRQSTKNTS